MKLIERKDYLDKVINSRFFLLMTHIPKWLLQEHAMMIINMRASR